MFRLFSRFMISLLAVASLACSEDTATGPEEDNPPSMPAAQELQLEAPDNAPGEVQGLVAMANGWVNLGYLYASHTNNGGPAPLPLMAAAEAGSFMIWIHRLHMKRSGVRTTPAPQPSR